MKYLFVSAVLVVGLAIVAAAQESVQFIKSVGPLDIFMSDVRCCAPVHASILEKRLDPGSAVYYLFRNITDKPVVGIAVTFSNGKWTRLHYEAFVRRDAVVRPWVWKGFIGRRGEELKIEVDFLLYSDRTSWGPDSLGRGVFLKDFQKGYDLALERVLKEAGGTPIEQLDKLLETTIGIQYTVDLPLNGPERKSFRTPFVIGYDGVVTILARGDEAARGIAEKVRTRPIE